MNKKSLLFFSLGFLWISYVFIDVVRRFFDGSTWLLLVVDVSVIAVFIVYSFVNQNSLMSKRLVNTVMFFFIALFVFIVFLQILNQTEPSVLLTIAGLRTYLLPIPFLFVGYAFSLIHHPSDYHRASNFILVILYLVVLFALLQFLIDRSGIGGIFLTMLTPMTPGTHGYGEELFQLSTSFFAGSKRYASFLLLSYLLLWGSFKDQKLKIILLFIIVLVGLLVGGARDSLWMFLFFHVVYILSNKSRFLAFLPFGVVSLLILSMGVGFSDFDFGLRLKFLVASEDDLLGRFLMLFPFLKINFDSELLFTGIGLGRYGAESLLDPSISQLSKMYLHSMLYKYEFFNNALGFDDSGLTKIYIELGIIGLVAYLSLLLSAIYVALRSMRGNVSHLSFALSYYVLVYIVLGLKAHQFISNIFMTSLFYFSLGYLIFNWSITRSRGVKIQANQLRRQSAI
jgi:hypothetical protein